MSPGGRRSRVETDDFEAWKVQHYLHVQNRVAFGLTDGPAYREMENPNATRRATAAARREADGRFPEVKGVACAWS